MIANFEKYVIVGGLCLSVGFITGYETSSRTSEIEKLKTEKIALEQERQNLYEQIGVEHDRQEAIQRTSMQTREDLADLEKRYSDAMRELSSLQLFIGAKDGDSASALPADSKATGGVSKGSCKCGGKDTRALQKLLDEQMTLARDCDINATYLNSLIDLYNSMSK